MNTAALMAASDSGDDGGWPLAQLSQYEKEKEKKKERKKEKKKEKRNEDKKRKTDDGINQDDSQHKEVSRGG